MSSIIINQDLCKGCMLCIRACPKKLLQLAKETVNEKGYHPAEINDESACIGCVACALTCPDICIEVER